MRGLLVTIQSRVTNEIIMPSSPVSVFASSSSPLPVLTSSAGFYRASARSRACSDWSHRGFTQDKGNGSA